MQYRFDKESFSFKKVTTSVGVWVLRVAWTILGTFAMSIVCYVLLSFFLNSDLERQLSRENRMYERLYDDFLEQQKLIGNVTDGLQKMDDEIYQQLFHADAPSVDPAASLDLEIPVDVESVEENFRSIFEALVRKGGSHIPQRVPIAHLSYAQTGASVGMKYNPFYKIESQHAGLDIIAPQGEAVLATAAGIVEDVVRAGKGLGNVVTLDHGDGYQTRYGHLGDIYVTKGQKVECGRKIGLVGISGNTFAPHLHYEVLLDGVQKDPVDYMFGSLTPSQYADIAFVASRTGQSLD